MDTVQSRIKDYTLEEGLEQLILIGKAENGTGNGEDNVIVGNSRDNTLNGGAGDDLLYGLGGNDHLIGGDGNDTLNGGKGEDTLEGGMGDDIYYTDGKDVLLEQAGGGSDTVFSSAAYILGEHFENLTLTGRASLDGTGNAEENILLGNKGDNLLRGLDGNDLLIGGNGNDTLDGGAGEDVLIGGKGSDTFLFGEMPSGEVDTVKDFNAREDHIALAKSAFTALGDEFDAAAFGREILFDAASGALSYDADGAGGAEAVQFATLNGKYLDDLDASNFYIV